MNEDQDEKQIGAHFGCNTMYFYAQNFKEFKELLEKAERLSCELRTVMSKLSCFSFKFKIVE